MVILGHKPDYVNHNACFFFLFITYKTPIIALYCTLLRNLWEMRMRVKMHESKDISKVPVGAVYVDH